MHKLAAPLAGAFAATGFAPLELWPLALAALAVLMGLIAQAETMRSALLTGWLFGVGHFAVGNNWIAGAFEHQDAMPHWLGWIAVVLLALYLAIYPAVAAGLAWRWGRPRTWVFVLMFAAAWIVTEYLRAVLFTGFAWNPLGVLWLPTGLVRTAPYVGTYGLSGIAVLASGVLMSLAGAVRSRSVVQSSAPIAALLVMGVLASWPLPRAVPATGPVVRVVQPNIGLNEGRDIAVAREGLAKLARLSGVPGPEPRLLFWPEAALNDAYEIAYDPRLRDDLAALLGPEDLLVTGGTRIEYRKRIGVGGLEAVAVGATNSVFALDATGAIRLRYDKAHLVPYGEYLPARPLLSAIGLARLVPGDLDFWPGPGPLSASLGAAGKIGVQICYEIIFSGQVVDRRDRPDFIFNPSNDAWFGTWGPPQHLAQARLRAIEEGLPVIRSTPTGISAVIDARGQIAVAIPLGKAGFIQTRMPAAAAPTPFARAGNLLPLGLAALLAGIAIALSQRNRYGHT
ncbi:MAG: apolipoprotein N-acyltransferase [Sphingomonadaceae bacterium]